MAGYRTIWDDLVDNR